MKALDYFFNRDVCIKSTYYDSIGLEIWLNDNNTIKLQVEFD